MALTVKDMQIMYEQFKPNLTKPDVIVSVLTRAIETPYLDFDNLVISYIQNMYTKSLKTELMWNNCGYSVIEGSNPIYVIDGVTKVVYKDRDTGDIADVTTLSPNELQLAIGLGVITKSYESVDSQVNVLYDISNVKVFDKKLAVEHKKLKDSKLSIKSISNVLESEGVIIEDYELNSDIEHCIIYTAILRYMSEHSVKAIPDDSMNLVVNLMHSLLTGSNFEIGNISNCDDLINHAKIAVTVFRAVQVEYDLNIDADDRSLKKASALYNIMEANSLLRRWVECQN